MSNLNEKRVQEGVREKRGEARTRNGQGEEKDLEREHNDQSYDDKREEKTKR